MEILFGRTTRVTQEQDVIQAFVYYCSFEEIPIGWESLHQKAEYDAWISETAWVDIAKKINKDESRAVIEFKRNVRGILEDTIQNLGQIMDFIDVIVCNDDPLAEDLTKEPYKNFTFIPYEDDAKGLKANFYPDLGEGMLDLLKPIRVWKGNRAKKSKQIRQTRQHCLIISLQRIYDFFDNEEE